MIERNKRNNCEQFGMCSDPCKRNERNTPLGGVTVVRWFDMVPMPLFADSKTTRHPFARVIGVDC